MSSAQVPTTVALARALSKTGPSPCDHYQCAHRSECASQHLACNAYLHYIRSGKTVPPQALFVNELPVMQDDRYVRVQRTFKTNELFVASEMDE